MSAATLIFLVPVGSADEGQPGTAHVLEHVIHADPQGLGALRAMPGLSVHAVTTPGWTAYTATMPPARLAEVASAFRRILDPTVLTSENIERQKAVILQEIDEVRPSHSRQSAIDTFERQLFADTLLAQHPLGDKNAVEALTLEALRSLHQLYANRLQLVVAAGPQSLRDGTSALRSSWQNAQGFDWSAPKSIAFKPWVRPQPDLTASRLEHNKPVTGITRPHIHLYRMVNVTDLPVSRRAAASDWLAAAMGLSMDGSLHWALQRPRLLSGDFNFRIDWLGRDQVVLAGQGSLAGETSSIALEDAVDTWLDTVAAGKLRPALVAAADQAMRTQLTRPLDADSAFRLARQLLDWGETTTPPMQDLALCATDAQHLAANLLKAPRQGRLTLLPGEAA